MPRFKHRFITSTCFILFAPVVFADVTADEVWTDWESYIGGLGYELSGTESRSGSVLTISDLTISVGDGETGSMNATMERIVFSEQSDGTVLITLPAVSQIVASTPNETGGDTKIAFDYIQDGLEIVASGTAASLNYAYDANAITIKTTDFSVNGASQPADANAIEVSFDTLSGRTDMSLDTQRRYDQSVQVDAVRYNMKFSDTATDNTATVLGQILDVDFAGTAGLPLRVVQATNMGAMLDAGFSVDGTITFAASSQDMAFTGPDDPFSTQSTSQGGSVGVDMNQSGLTYDLKATGLNAQLAAAAFPIPVTYAVETMGFKLTLPVRKSEKPDDFAFGLTLGGVTISDMLWGLFDPTGQLPRDPATIALDVAGKARLLADFFNPENANLAANPAPTPAEIDSVDINKLQINLAGADLSGSGAFKFNNSQNGPPKPSGAVDLTLVGGNALLDRLVAIGLLPEQQAMGARMMMGLLAVPGEAPDTLNSKIEVNEQGHVMANGQRIQ